MADYIFVGGVANVFVEYHGEDDNAENNSGSDFEDECLNMSDDEPDEIITAKPAESDEVIAVSAAESDEMVEMFVPNDNGVITHVISSPLKQPSVSKSREEIPGTDTDLQSVTITNSEEREHSSDSEDDMTQSTCHIVKIVEKIQKWLSSENMRGSNQTNHRLYGTRSIFLLDFENYGIQRAFLRGLQRHIGGGLDSVSLAGLYWEFDSIPLAGLESIGLRPPGPPAGKD
jgi:hypothetical protein